MLCSQQSRRFLACLCALGAMMCSPVSAQTDTTFTYQGSLNDQGAAANGSFNLTFALFDALGGGSQIGSTIVMNSVPVTDGLLTVELDFGASAFDNTGRWLEIAVNGTTLSPRQPINRSPYSIQTRGIFVDANQMVGIGTAAPEAPLHVHDGTAGAVVAHGNSIAAFERDGEGFLSILTPDTAQRGILFGDPESFVNGSIIYNNGAVPDGFQFRTGGNRTNMVIDADGNVGIGTVSPEYRLQVFNSELITFDSQNTSTSGSALAIRGLSESSSGIGVFGITSATSGSGYGVSGQSMSSSGRGVSGVASSNVGTNYGVYGQSNSTSGFDFYAAGLGTNYGAASSRRWKNNIENIDHPLQKIAQLRGVYYDWDTEHGGHHDVGMIAEEVGAVLPEIVNYEENGIDAIGMDYSKITPLLVEAVNALRTEKNRDITTLRRAHAAEINDLRQQLSDLQQIVERLALNQEKESR